MYLEKAHIQRKEWIQLTYSRIQWHNYKRGNDFTASVKGGNFLTSSLMFNFSLAPQIFIHYHISFP